MGRRERKEKGTKIREEREWDGDRGIEEERGVRGKDR